MRVRWKYLFSVLLASTLAMSWGCSDEQQQEDVVEAEGQEDEYGEDQQGEEGDQYAENQEQGEEGDQYAENQEQGEEGDQYAEDGDQYAEEGEDVQTIVADLNENEGGEELGMEGSNVVETDNSLADGGAASAPSASGSAGGGLPEFGSKMPYIVRSGDTLGGISTKIYGAPDRWAQIAELSALSNPSKIFPGDVVYYQLTEETLAFATRYESLSKQEIVVGSGDTLTSISSRVYGSSMDWKFIWRHNDQVVDPDRLSPGDVIFYVDSSSLTAATKSETNKLDVKIAQVTLDKGVTVVKLEPTDDRYESQGNMFDVFANMLTDKVAG